MSRSFLILALALAAWNTPAQEPDWNAGGTLHVNQSLDSTQDIALQRPLTLNIDAGHTVSLRGLIRSPIAGLHTLAKEGDGQLELWGENTGITKDLWLRGGTLHLAGRYALGADSWAQLNVHRGTTLSYEDGATVAATLLLHDELSQLPGTGYNTNAIQWRVDHGTATQIGPILGTTPMIKTGAGTLRLLDGNNSPHSQLTIAKGILQLDSRFAGRISVQHAATLTGSGLAGTLEVTPGGILAPTERLRVSHRLQFHPESQLHIRAWADGRSDSVHVLDGKAGLDGRVIVLPQGVAQDWETPTTSVIVHAGDGLGGTRFTSVESALPWLEPELLYSENDVSLLLRRRQNLPALPKGLPSGWAASVHNMLIDDSRFIRDAAYASAGAQVKRRGWTHAFHSSGQYGDSTASGPLHRHISGLLLGANMEVSPAWRLGVYGGASTTRARAAGPSHGAPYAGSYTSQDAFDAATKDGNTLNRPSATVDSLHLGLYGHHDMARGSQVTAGIAHSWHQVDSRRTAMSPVLYNSLSSRYRASTTQAFAQLQHPIQTAPDPQTLITPFVRLAWVHTHQDAHRERGGPLALGLASRNTDVLFSTLGVQAQRRLALPEGETIVTGALAWRHANGTTNAAIRQYFQGDGQRTPFAASGIPVIRNAWQLQLGINAEISKQTQLALNYSGQYGKRLQDHGVRLEVAMRW